MIRSRARSIYQRRLENHAKPLDRSAVECDAFVLAPHPDDETLGCGGLIALKRDLGARVSIIFMTDGAASHAGQDVQEVAAKRHVEATSAAAILGVGRDDLHFMDIADGALAGAEDEAVDLLVRIMGESTVTQVIVPHPLEPPTDHSATFSVAARSARRLGRDFDALLYPVWLWDQWPWANPLSAPRERHGRRQVASIAVRDRLGFTLTQRLSSAVDISSTLDRKIAALEAHASQMSRPIGEPDWLTLRDVAGGDWLDLLLQPTEYYEARRLSRTAVST